jgi:excisionase family DNA binding protein
MKYQCLPVATSVAVTAGVTDLSERTIHNLIKKGEIASTKIGRSRRILVKPLIERYNLDPDAVLDYLNANA